MTIDVPPYHSRAGTVLGDRYEVRRSVAKFGFAEVFEGYDRDLGRLVDLLAVRGPAAEAIHIEADLRHDLELVQRVPHPNVWQFQAYEPDPWGGVLVAEHLSGHSLHERIRDRKPSGFSATEFRSLAAQLCDALAAIHAAGIVHADVKPGRVQVEGERVVLRMFEFAEDATVLASRSGPDGGTPQYMSPERLRHGRASMQDDVYALGMTLLEAFTCRVPDPGQNPRAKPLWQQVTIDPLGMLGHDEFRQIFRMLHEDPDLRPRASHLRWGTREHAGSTTAEDLAEDQLYTTWVTGA